jgi:hypothetical protein
MYTQNGSLKKLMNTDDDLNYTTWYLVATAPLVDTPSPVVHLPFFAPECRATSDLRSVRTTAPDRLPIVRNSFPICNGFLHSYFMRKLDHESHRKWIFLFAFF